MTEPYFGVIINRDDTDPRPAVFSDLSVLGLCLPSDDADASAFPLNTPVDFNTGDATTLAKLGTGPLYKAVTAINNQLDDLQVSARCVAIRVATGSDDAHTIGNIVGNAGAGTGLYGFLRAGQLLGVVPRLIAAPGFTGQSLNGISTAVTITNRGSGYTAAPTVALSGGSGSGAAATATISRGVLSASVGAGGSGYTSATVAFAAPAGGGQAATGTATVSSGAVTGITVTNKGHGYGPSEVAAATISGDGTGATATATMTGVLESVVVTAAGSGYVSAPTIAFTGGSGTSAAATAAVDLYTNAICAALPAICSALLAHAVVGGPGLTKQDAINWRGTLNSSRLIPVDNWNVILGLDGASTEVQDGAATTLGVAVRVEHQNGGVPSHSWANQPVQGILGLKRYDSFSITDGATDGQELLAVNVGVTERGVIGSETAVAESGFVLVALDNAGNDPLWQFYNMTRLRDYIHLALLRTIRRRLGVTNVTPHGVQAVENDMAAVLAELKAGEHILGYKIGFEASKNSPENLRLGKFRVFFNAEEPAPIRQVTIDSRRYRDALVAELATLVAQANTLTA